MMKRLGATAFATIVGGLAAVGTANADLHNSMHRPALVEVGEPTMVDRSALRKEMERISDLKEHIGQHGWPDYAEVQAVVAEEPFADYEVRVYYLTRQREFDFAHVDAAPWLKDFGIKRYEGPIPTETLGRLLTAEPLDSPPVVVEAQTPPPPAVVVTEPVAIAEPVPAVEVAPAVAAPPSENSGAAVEEPAAEPIQ